MTGEIFALLVTAEAMLTGMTMAQG